MPSTFFFVTATLLLSLNFVRPFGLAISDWLYFGAFGLTLVETTFAKQKNWAYWTTNRFILPAGLILFGAIISTSRSQDVPTAIAEIIQQLYAITFFVSLSWIMVKRGHADIIVCAFIISGLFSTLVVLFDYFTGSKVGPILSGTSDIELWYRYAGTLGHPNKFGYFVALTSILTFGYLDYVKRNTVMSEVLLSIALVIQIFAVYLSGSVTAYLGVTVGFLFLLISSKILRVKTLKIALPIMTISVFLMIIVTVFDIKNPFNEIQIDTDNIISLSLGRVQSSTADTRINGYKQAWAQIEKSPIVGVGYDQMSTSGIVQISRFLDYSVHNVLLQIFYTGGVFAFTGWLIIYIYISWKSIEILITKNISPPIFGVAASVLSIVLMDQFQDAIYQREKWLIIGLMVGLYWNKKNNVNIS